MKSKNIFYFLIILGIAALMIIVFSAGEIEKFFSGKVDQAEIEKDPNVVEVENKLVANFPEFPVYPGAVIEKSSGRIETINTGQDLRAVWISDEKSVQTVMNWYIDELEKSGWQVEKPNDPIAMGEQVAQIKKDDLSGYIAVEDEAGTTEIVADFRKAQN